MTAYNNPHARTIDGVQCARCGLIYRTPAKIVVARQPTGTWTERFCAECALREGYRQCAHCGKWHHKDGECWELATARGEYVCDACLMAQRLAICAQCGLAWPTGDVEATGAVYGGTPEHVCRGCAAELDEAGDRLLKGGE